MKDITDKFMIGKRTIYITIPVIAVILVLSLLQYLPTKSFQQYGASIPAPVTPVQRTSSSKSADSDAGTEDVNHSEKSAQLLQLLKEAIKSGFDEEYDQPGRNKDQNETAGDMKGLVKNLVRIDSKIQELSLKYRKEINSWQDYADVHRVEKQMQDVRDGKFIRNNANDGSDTNIMQGTDESQYGDLNIESDMNRPQEGLDDYTSDNDENMKEPEEDLEAALPLSPEIKWALDQERVFQYVDTSVPIDKMVSLLKNFLYGESE